MNTIFLGGSKNHVTKMSSRQALKKIFLLLLLAGFTIASLLVMWTRATELKTIVSCYHQPGNVLRELDDNEPIPGASIFFHESSCEFDISDIRLKARQACSIESALLAHPKIDVYLLISHPVNVPYLNTTNVLVQKLLTYPNFKVRYIHFARYLSATPMKVLYESQALEKSIYPVPHASDILRYTTLYKFGGTYLDLDFIVLSPFDKFKNFAGAESDSAIAAGVLSFSNDEVGKEVATACAAELSGTYDGREWSSSSVGVITKVMEKRCKTTNVSEMVENQEKCKGFRVLPQKYFYPYPHRQSGLLFEAGNTEKLTKLLKDSYAVHFWNKLSEEYVLDKQDIPFLKYAQEYCPKTNLAVKGEF